MRAHLFLERLEDRQMLSADSWQDDYSLAEFISSTWGDAPDSAVPITSSTVPGSISSSSTVASTRWDWLAGTTWYCKPENLLAYLAQPDLSDPKPVSDQTIWTITQCVDGVLSGSSDTYLAGSSEPITTVMSGIVTESGQVRIQFSSNTITNGIGQMRFVDGQWRVEMQMATGNSSILTHWAYMTQLQSGETPPAPTDPAGNGSLLSEEYRWLEGTHWVIIDSTLFDNSAHAGVFEINSFRNGYFWGSGTSSDTFNVLGSVTPEGNVLFLISVDGQDPVKRTGFLSDGVMRLRTYEGQQPDVGAAWLISGNGEPSLRPFMSSVVGITS